MSRVNGRMGSVWQTVDGCLVQSTGDERLGASREEKAVTRHVGWCFHNSRNRAEMRFQLRVPACL